jgi:hypothetical protein
MRSAFVVLAVCVLLTMDGPNNIGSPSRPKGVIVFEGMVLKISSPVPASGRITAYRLVKYRVEKVCKGKYDRTDIVVDHLILTGKEFEGVEVGDRLWLTVGTTKKISPRYNAEGIRDESEPVDFFYVARSLSRIPPSICSLTR